MAVYIYHFSRPYHHARHYVGFTDDFERRAGEHINGRSNGSPLIRAALDAGIKIICAVVWQGADRDFERRLKRRKNTGRYCPLCRKAAQGNIHRQERGEA